MSILDYVVEETRNYLESMPKSIRKKRGQFFTTRPTAEYMASMFDLSSVGSEVSILDPGSGTGILAAALIDRLSNESIINKINLTCYETDEEVLTVLFKNLEYIKQNISIDFEYTILQKDYITSQADDFNRNLFDSSEQKFDCIIGNPPYVRISRNHIAALSMPSVVCGAPNYYFLFASMSVFNLKPNGEMVYIIPRSWTSGAYFKLFREYLLSNSKIERVHLFVSRDKVFGSESVLQETMIIKLIKTQSDSSVVRLTSSNSGMDFSNVSRLDLPYDQMVSGKNLYVYLPISLEQVSVLEKINKLSHTLPDIGLRMRTGIIVDFREQESLRSVQTDNVVPLFYSQHIKNGRVHHEPSGKQFDWVILDNTSLIQLNKNYLFLKRFTAKEEPRRLQAGIYLSSDFNEFAYIGTHNKINYIDNVDKSPLCQNEVYGLYGIFNSTIYDQYYRILNGSTQVNSTEVNSIPVPPREKIMEIGKRLIAQSSLSTDTCDHILEEVVYGEN